MSTWHATATRPSIITHQESNDMIHHLCSFKVNPTIGCWIGLNYTLGRSWCFKVICMNNPATIPRGLSGTHLCCAHSTFRLASRQAMKRPLPWEDAKIGCTNAEAKMSHPHVLPTSRGVQLLGCVEPDLEDDSHRTWALWGTIARDSDWDALRRLRIYAEKTMEPSNGLDGSSWFFYLRRPNHSERARYSQRILNATGIVSRSPTSVWIALFGKHRHQMNRRSTKRGLSIVSMRAERLIRIGMARKHWRRRWPFAGCTLLDVGWMRVCYDGFLLLVRNSHAWGYEYHRPPLIMQQWDEDFVKELGLHTLDAGIHYASHFTSNHD